MIETDSGTIDARINSQLAEVEAVLQTELLKAA